MERGRDDAREERRLRELTPFLCSVCGEPPPDAMGGYPCCNPECGGTWGIGCPHCHNSPQERRPPGRPRVHSEEARGFSVKLEPAHFAALDRVAEANGLPDKGSAVRHLVEAAETPPASHPEPGLPASALAADRPAGLNTGELTGAPDYKRMWLELTSDLYTYRAAPDVNAVECYRLVGDAEKLSGVAGYSSETDENP